MVQHLTPPPTPSLPRVRCCSAPLTAASADCHFPLPEHSPSQLRRLTVRDHERHQPDNSSAVTSLIAQHGGRQRPHSDEGGVERKD